jgi:hypothetical protein
LDEQRSRMLTKTELPYGYGKVVRGGGEEEN